MKQDSSARDRDWIVAATLIVCGEYFIAFLLGASVGFKYSIPFSTYATVGATFGAIGLAICVPPLLLRYWRRGEDSPTARLLSDLPWSFAAGCILVGMHVAALTWFKVMMPLTVSFYADQAFADFDHFLFGTDPWKLSHAVLGHWSWLIDQIYTTWGLLKFSTLLMLLVLPPSFSKSRALLAYFIIVGGGALGQYLGASAGPIFWQTLGMGDRFAELPISPWVETTRDYLWSDHLRGGGLVGGGISAMPSLHVAVALWIALVCRLFLPRFQIIGWIYFGAILIGSVHLGWHYAADGLVASIGVVTIWRWSPSAIAGISFLLASKVDEAAEQQAGSVA